MCKIIISLQQAGWRYLYVTQLPGSVKNLDTYIQQAGKFCPNLEGHSIWTSFKADYILVNLNSFSCGVGHELFLFYFCFSKKQV